MNTIYAAPVCTLKNLNNLFIELTAKNCNQRCKNCYIDFPINKNVKDFISVDKIKEALNDLQNQNLECIYLTGAEPMTHTDFNLILRLCLQYTNVCIFTNGSFINEKKARFLKRVEDESDYQIIFKLSIDHYNEIKNDEIRARGSYRQVINAVKSLVKYDFNFILSVTDYYNEGAAKLISEFKNVFKKYDIELENYNFKINCKYEYNEITEWSWKSLDCEYGRILTEKGIYTCPFLANDHRGRCGSSFKDFSHKNNLETDFCTTCIKNQTAMFSL